MTWCPTPATNSESNDPSDTGDFQPPQAPDYESQKNIEKIGYDPRTDTLLGSQGGFGTFGEDPPTTMKIIRSKDCGKTWQQVCDFGDFIGGQYWPQDGNFPEEDWETTTLYTTMYLPVNIQPGVNPGDWIMMDLLGGYYISTDDGVTWSTRAYSLITNGVENAGGSTGFFLRYGGIIGGVGFFDTRTISLIKYQGGSTYGFIWTLVNEDGVTEISEFLGVKRGLPSGNGIEWSDSLPVGYLEDGGTNWGVGGMWPVVGGANGRWIAIVDYGCSVGWWGPGYVDREVPQARINYSENLDPDAWGEPFWLISREWLEDKYEGMADHLFSFDRRPDFEQGHGRLKFIPMEGHPVGGRWWLLGIIDTILYSDDNGDTWSRSLAYHPGPEEDMHPILNWRHSHPLGYRASECRVLDIAHDPFGSGRLISIGITYDRPELTNRLAVFSCSTDGGDTWGSVGQLPLQLSRSQDYVGNQPGRDATSIARHIFPCLPPGE